MSSDEAYNEFIEYDSDIGDTNYPGATTSEEKPSRKERRTTFQFLKLSNFMDTHNKKELGKVVFNELWDILICELNELGPPYRSSEKWKQVWFDYKSRNLKKSKLSTKTDNPIAQQTSSSASEVLEKGERSRRSKKMKLDDTVEMIPIYIENLEEEQAPPSVLPSKGSDNENIDSSHFQMKVIEKLDAITEMTKKMCENREALVDGNKMTNELLQKLLSK